VLMDKDGMAKLADFGYTVLMHVLLGRIQNEEREIPGHFWLAPENVKGSDTIETRSDIWSIGCLLYEMIMSYPPFFEETEGSVEELKKIHRQKSISF
jgi:eukaryotic-like serine/threonine-protein kinase